jgi:hypothetical protein
MTPATALTSIIRPAAALLHALGGPPPSDAADRMLLAIALQESGLVARYQGSPDATPGPAHSLWQMEVGGVQGVLYHPASAAHAAELCAACDVQPTGPSVWRAIEGHDLLAAALARLLLWTDPNPLPATEDAGWTAYSGLWRPGAPSRARWATAWATAVQHVPTPAAEVVA